MTQVQHGTRDLWAQRARHNWIAFGDKNTKNFQMVATIRKRHNFIGSILDENGIWSDDQHFICRYSLENSRRDSLLALTLISVQPFPCL